MSDNKTLTIRIEGAEHMQTEPAARSALFTLIERHSHSAEEINCYLSARSRTGFLEWLVHLYRSVRDKTPFTIGLVQRSADGEVSFHS